MLVKFSLCAGIMKAVIYTSTIPLSYIFLSNYVVAQADEGKRRKKK